VFAGLALALLWRQTRGHWRLRVRSSAMEVKSREVR
jgi:hypothetical protein